MVGMFHDAISFNQPIDFSDTSKVETMHRMFAYATSFNQRIVFNTSNVKTMMNMFA